MNSTMQLCNNRFNFEYALPVEDSDLRKETLAKLGQLFVIEVGPNLQATFSQS